MTGGEEEELIFFSTAEPSEPTFFAWVFFCLDFFLGGNDIRVSLSRRDNPNPAYGGGQ